MKKLMIFLMSIFIVSSVYAEWPDDGFTNTYGNMEIYFFGLDDIADPTKGCNDNFTNVVKQIRATYPDAEFPLSTNMYFYTNSLVQIYRIGVGTNSARASLDIVQAAADTTPPVRLTTASRTGVRMDSINASADARNWFMGNTIFAPGDFAISQGNNKGDDPSTLVSATAAIYIDPDRNVGIGIITPAYELDVSGDVNITGQYYTNGVLLDITGGGGSGTLTGVEGGDGISTATNAAGTVVTNFVDSTVARDTDIASVSNAFVAADVIVSNAFVAADTVVSNGVTTGYTSADTIVSNGVTTAFVASDVIVSNGVTAAFQAEDVILTNAIIDLKPIYDALPDDRPIFNYVTDGTTVTGIVDTTDGDGSFIVNFDSAKVDFSAPVELVLDNGTTNAQQFQYIYATPDGITNSTSFPSGEYAMLFDLSLLDAAKTQEDGVFTLRRWTDKVSGPNGQKRSFVQRIAERVRREPSVWVSGGDLSSVVTSVGGDEDDVFLTTASGTAYQMHRQTFDAITATNGTVEYHIYNDPSIGISHITNLNQITQDANGNTVLNTGNSYFNVAVLKHISSGTTNLVDTDIILNLSLDDYATEANALADASGNLVLTVPNDMIGETIVLGFITLNRAAAGGGTWTATVTSLLGTPVGGQGGGASSLPASSTFTDSAFKVVDDVDPTKIIQLEADQITTGTTRTFTAPDADGTLFITPAAESLNFNNQDATNAVLMSASSRIYAGYLQRVLQRIDGGIDDWDPVLQGNGSGTNADLTVNGGFAFTQFDSEDERPANLWLSRSKSDTLGTQSMLSEDDDIGRITFSGSDGSSLQSSAAIAAEVDATPGLSDMPGRLIFLTTADGSASVAERMRIDSSGNVGIGTDDPDAKLTVNGGEMYHRMDGASGGSGFYQYRAVANEGAPVFGGFKARGSTGSEAVVQEDDQMFRLSGRGYDGSAYSAGADIYFRVDGTPGVSDMPGRIEFYTSVDGAAAPVERMRLDNAGNFGIGTNAPSVKLDVIGDASITGDATLTSNMTFQTTLIEGILDGSTIAAHQFDIINLGTIPTNFAWTVTNFANTATMTNDITWSISSGPASAKFQSFNVELAVIGANTNITWSGITSLEDAYIKANVTNILKFSSYNQRYYVEVLRGN